MTKKCFCLGLVYLLFNRSDSNNYYLWSPGLEEPIESKECIIYLKKKKI